MHLSFYIICIASVISLDLIFVLVTSGKVKRKIFESMKAFVQRMVDAFFEVRSLVHLGAIAVGTTLYDISPLTSSFNEFLHAVIKFQHQDGGTNITGALLEARNMFLSSRRNASRLKRVLILITDGRSSRHSIRSGLADMVPDLARHSIERYVFFVGNRVNGNELRAIASPPRDRHVFSVTTFSVFQHFAEFVMASNYIPTS